MMALTKSPWPWKRLVGLREERDHDQIDLSQHAANSVSDLGRTATDVSGAVGPEKVATTLLVDFNVNSLYVACCFGYIDVILIVRVGDDVEDLGGELQRAAVGVLGLGSLAGRLLQRRATPCQRAKRKRKTDSYVVWK